MKFLFRARWSLVSLHFGIQSLWHGWRIRTRRIQEFSKCSSGTLESGQSSRREWCFRQACTCTCFKLVCKSILLCNPARFACLSRTHKWKEKEKKKKGKNGKIFFFLQRLFLYFDEIINPCSRFPLVYLPFLTYHNVNIEFRWIWYRKI